MPKPPDLSGEPVIPRVTAICQQRRREDRRRSYIGTARQLAKRDLTFI